MDSRIIPTGSSPAQSFVLPAWTALLRSAGTESDAAFSAGIALKTLDDLVRTEPVWSGCWRARLALRSAAAAVRLTGRTEGEAELRDAMLLSSDAGDPGPAGHVYCAYRKLGVRNGPVNTAILKELAMLLSLRWDDHLAGVVDLIDGALQSPRSAPFAAADLVSAIHAVRPDAERLTWALADGLIAQRLGWQRPLFLLMAQRSGPAFRTLGGRGRVRSGEPGFARAVCLALVEGARAALQSASEIDRRARQLVTVAPKLRTKGGEGVLRRLLDEDAVSASAPGANLSRWASRRMFERLEASGAVRELSGRSTFRIYGL
ncbi:DUF1403 family protein [Rhizobium sp. NFR03]|uniref:DUF1403 family protein n=1 Tax=Rhizobium sp. NFR03 TaxID=1566263 RepID=UPI0008D2E79C|nr:DUF1403 family protein [Rhizobium sp. NFR03]SES42651.1 Protein of unknown function [Rhizobium sp. NFR03]